MIEQKITEMREKSELGRVVNVQANTVHDLMADIRFLLSELDKRDEENSRLHRKMIAKRQTTGALQKRADRVEKENRKLREELKEAREEIKGLDEMIMH